MLKCATIQCNVKTKMNIQRRTALKTFCVGITDGEVTLQGLFIIDIIDLSLSKQGQSFWAPLKVRLRKTDFWHNIKYLDLKGIQCKELWWWWWSGCCVMTSGPAPDWQKLEKETADKGWDAALHLSTSSSATSQSKQKPPGKQTTCRWLKWCCLQYLYNVIWLFLFDNLNVSWLDGGSIKRNHGAVLFIADNW